MDITELLAERQKTHGDFTVHARITQRLKAILKAEMNYERLSDPHKESLDMLCHKMGRIISGNPNFKDHWDDIAGYAKLVADRCPDAPKPTT